MCGALLPINCSHMRQQAVLLFLDPFEIFLFRQEGNASRLGPGLVGPLCSWISVDDLNGELDGISDFKVWQSGPVVPVDGLVAIAYRRGELDGFFRATIHAIGDLCGCNAVVI